MVASIILVIRFPSEFSPGLFGACIDQSIQSACDEFLNLVESVSPDLLARIHDEPEYSPPSSAELLALLDEVAQAWELPSLTGHTLASHPVLELARTQSFSDFWLTYIRVYIGFAPISALNTVARFSLLKAGLRDLMTPVCGSLPEEAASSPYRRVRNFAHLCSPASSGALLVAFAEYWRELGGLGQWSAEVARQVVVAAAQASLIVEEGTLGVLTVLKHIPVEMGPMQMFSCLTSVDAKCLGFIEQFAEKMGLNRPHPLANLSAILNVIFKEVDIHYTRILLRMAGPLRLPERIPERALQSIGMAREMVDDVQVRETLGMDAKVFLYKNVEICISLAQMQSFFVYSEVVRVPWLEIFAAETPEEAAGLVNKTLREARRALVYLSGCLKLEPSFNPGGGTALLTTNDGKLENVQLDVFRDYKLLSHTFKAELDRLIDGEGLDVAYAFAQTRISASLAAGTALMRRFRGAALKKREYLQEAEVKTATQWFWRTLVLENFANFDNSRVKAAVESHRDDMDDAVAEMIEQDFADTQHDLCPICREDIDYEDVHSLVFFCGHSMHNECLHEQVSSGSRTCPLCRSWITILRNARIQT